MRRVGLRATRDRTAVIACFGRLTATFDARRSITDLLDPQGGRSTWTFDALARWTQRQLPDGWTSTAAYDAAGRLTGVLHKTSGGSVIDQALMAYDAVDNPLKKVTLDGVDTMTYDAANQLLSEYHPIAGVKTWTFDPVGNRLSQDFTQVRVRTLTNWAYDAADQITLETTGTAVTTYTFDAAGNEQVVQTPGGRTTNIWDSENRLTGVQLPGGGRNTMAYRADNLRHQLADSEATKLMVWDELGYSGYIDLVQENKP